MCQGSEVERERREMKRDSGQRKEKEGDGGWDKGLRLFGN